MRSSGAKGAWTGLRRGLPEELLSHGGVAGGMLAVLALSVWLTGCAGMIDAEPVATTAAPPKPIELPKPRPVHRELGSLWSETSPWNEIYSEAPRWVSGDVLTVQLTERFRSHLLSRLNREYPVRVETKVDVEDKKEPIKVEVKNRDDKLQPDDSGTMHATVIEQLPRFRYRIAASESIRLGGRNPLITFEGEILARDIQPGDTVSADKILNIALDLKPYGRTRKLASDD